MKHKRTNDRLETEFGLGELFAKKHPTVKASVALSALLSDPHFGLFRPKVEIPGTRRSKSLCHQEVEMKAKRAAIYVRCSTKSQETDMQEAELTEYVGRRGWEYTIYRDAGQSGAKENRPALDCVLSHVRKRKVDVLCVWAWDRLARSLKQLLSIAEECRSLGVDLVSLKQNVDTTLPAGRLTFQVLGAVAEFEREMLRTRVKAGLEMARRNGKKLGRPPLRRFARDEKTEIRQLRKAGASIRSLAGRFGTTQYIINQVTAAQV